MHDVAIRVEQVGKRYRLGSIGGGTLREDLSDWWRRARGGGDADAPPAARAAARHQALRDVTFDVRQGQAVGIIGRNGAGKSTLLKLMSRITAPTSGRIRIRGRVGSLLEVGTGFHPELTGRENIFLNGAILGMRKREIAAELDAIVDFSELAPFIDTPVKRYSSGMYVRLAFAVAAHLRSEILIVDEVLSVGDAAFQERCLGKLDHVAHAGRTVLFVSHQMATIHQLCDRCLLLEDGALVADGAPAEVIERYMVASSLRRGASAHTACGGPAAPGQKARIASVRVVDDAGRPLDCVDNDGRGSVEIGFEILEGGITCNVAFELHSAVHGVVLTSGLWDADFGRRSRERWRRGRYTCRAELPLGQLREGTYSLRTVLLKPNYENFDVVDHHPVFHVVDRVTPPAILAEGRLGVVNPLLAWSRSDDGAAAKPERHAAAVR